MIEFQPTGQQTMTQQQADQFLAEARQAPNSKNPRVLAINQIPVMRAKNNGYPIHMYHESLEMRMAMKEEEEMALAQMGYQRQYIPKEYPKALFRRNMAPKFEPQFDAATGLQTNIGFVEQITCRDAKHEAELRRMSVKPGLSGWFEKVTDIPELEDGPSEDPRVTIARLQGQIAGLMSEVEPEEVDATAPRRGRGRPKKEAETVAA